MNTPAYFWPMSVTQKNDW